MSAACPFPECSSPVENFREHWPECPVNPTREPQYDGEINALKAGAPYHGFPCPICRSIPSALDVTGKTELREGASYQYECDSCGGWINDYLIERDGVPYSKATLAAGETCPECDGRLMHPPDREEFDAVEWICLDCARPVEPDAEENEREPAHSFPEWVPNGGPNGCRDCKRGKWDGVDVSPRKTWGIYPQDRYRENRKPTLCDGCWEWRKELAPLKPEKKERSERFREVNQ